MARHRSVEVLNEAKLAHGLSRTPLDHFVIWDGIAAGGQRGSLRARTLALITEAWAPVSLRELIVRAARIEGAVGFDPDLVREAVRQHQRARGATHLLVRRTAGGDFLAVTDIPSPASHPVPIFADALVLDRSGRRLPILQRAG